jgi:hypothetical protein
MQDNHVIDEPGRHPKIPGSLRIVIAFFNERINARTQFDRMRLAAHGGSPS